MPPPDAPVDALVEELADMVDPPTPPVPAPPVLDPPVFDPPVPAPPVPAPPVPLPSPPLPPPVVDVEAVVPAGPDAPVSSFPQAIKRANRPTQRQVEGRITTSVRHTRPKCRASF
jgi:hypothetical protein